MGSIGEAAFSFRSRFVKGNMVIYLQRMGERRAFRSMDDSLSWLREIVVSVNEALYYTPAIFIFALM